MFRSHEDQHPGEARKAKRPSRSAPSGGQPAKPVTGREDRGMGKVVVRIPLVSWRDGRPRFSPGPKHRALGYGGEDLRHPPFNRDGRPVGPWFSLEEAIAWSARRVAELGIRAAGDPARSEPARRVPGFFTVGQLCEGFLSSPRCTGRAVIKGKRRRDPLAANTVRGYRGSARLLEALNDGRIWTASAEAVTAATFDGVIRRVEEGHGLAQARAVRAFLSVAYAWGRGEKKVAGNPAAESGERLPALPKRVRPASIAELEHLVAVADALGLPDAGDVMVAGAWTGARQEDRLTLPASAHTADGFMFTIGKTKIRLLIPEAAALRARLEAAKARRKGWTVQPMTLLACDATRRPWKQDHWRKIFAGIRAAAATGQNLPEPKGRKRNGVESFFRAIDVPARLAEAGLAPMPSVADLHDQDLRDTLLSWGALAGLDKWEMAGFSGHAFGKDDAVLGHYVAIPPEFARRGMVKLERWYAERAQVDKSATHGG